MATQNVSNDEHSEQSGSQILDAIGMCNENSINMIHLRIPNEKIPKLGMEFETEDDAYQFYQAYAKEVSFGTRISKGHKNQYTGIYLDRIFCCSREGKRSKDKRDCNVRIHRAETRCNCAAMMKINSRQTGKYRIILFKAEHNHELTDPSMVHMFRSHRKMMKVQESQVDGPDNSVTSRELKTERFNGVIKNRLPFKRSRAMRLGDGGHIMEHLQKMQMKDPDSFYAIQVDEDDSITNVFWADGKMKSDYTYFGDVVCFDTTYRTHSACPVALFLGVNHHKQAIIFGVAFVYDDSTNTFEWLFDAFAGAMGKPPSTILTDTDEQITTALKIKCPKAHHRFCTWQIYQHSATHLSNLFSGSENFVTEFSSCLYDYETENDFIISWKKMVDVYDLHDNIWLQNLFKSREKWAVVYERGTFSADIGNILRNESINITIKNDLLRFLQHLQKFLNEHRFKELSTDLKANQSTNVCLLPIEILKHADSVYTQEVFDQFKGEVCKAYDCIVISNGINEYRITQPGKDHHFVVLYDSSSELISCSCKKFEFVGILCAHALKVLSLRCILRIPCKYILKRWTKSAKEGNTADVSGNTVMTEPNTLMGRRYKKLCQLYVQLAKKASQDDQTYRIAKNGFLRVSEEVEVEVDSDGSGSPVEYTDEMSMVVKCSNLRERGVMESVRNECDKRSISSVTISGQNRPPGY